MGLKCMMTAMLAATLTLAVGAADAPFPDKPPEGWQQYIQPGRAYAFWVPKANRKLAQQEGTLAIKGETVKYTVFECVTKDKFKIDALVLNLPVKKGDEVDFTTVVEMVRDIQLKKVGGTVSSESDTKVGKVPGKEYVIDLKGGRKSRLRVYLSSPTVYEVSVTGTKEQVDGEMGKLVLGSFKHAGMVRAMLRKKAPPKKTPDKQPEKKP